MTRLGSSGLTVNGLNVNGLNVNGLNVNGLNVNGLNVNGLNVNGLNVNGLNVNGLNLSDLRMDETSLNGLSISGMVINGVALPANRLNGLTLNGLELSKVSIGGVNLNGVRLNGLSLSRLNLSGSKIDGAAPTSSQVTQLKLALSYIAKCAMASEECVDVTDVDGVSTFSLCGESGLDPDWGSDMAASVLNEPAVTECVLDIASGDPAHPSNTVAHTNQEGLIVKDFFNHAVSCALPASHCVTVTDLDGSSTYQACGSEGLDPAWETGPGTQGTVAAQVAECVASKATAHNDAWFDYRERFKTLIKYATQCALREDQSLTITDWDGSSVTWEGSLGLAGWWASGPLNPAPAPLVAETGDELVSACLLARSNALGKTVSISLRARPEIGASTAEAAAYTRHEGAFMGNLFGSTAVARSCSGPGGGTWLWDPATNAPLTAGRDCAAGGACGFEYLGACTSICNVKPGVNGETLFDECAGNSHVINTFLYESPSFDVDDADRTYSGVSGSTGDAAVVATGDFNADGNADLAIENNGASILVRLGTGTGGFAADVTYPLGTGVHVRSVIAKDVNQDGHLDLVTANESSLSVLLNNGNGTFAAATTLSVTNPAGASASVVAADYSGDGKLDLATNLTSGFGLFLGNGDGTFGAQSTISGPSAHHSVVTGDWNGDGKQDLASVSSSGASVYVTWGNGNGTFGSTATISAGSGTATTRSLVAGDFNADGKMDLAAAVSGANTALVLLGSSGGSFSAQSYSIGGSGTTAFVTAAYLDGDGAMDLMVGRGSSIVVLSGSATGAFTTANTFDVGESTSHVVAGHFDRDITWRLDLIASSDAGQLIQMAGI